MISISQRSYTNRKGEKVVVSEEHLATAIAIKEELQKNSPSRRVSWAQHKRMMQAEGYEDSDTNEGYRCLIKDEQKKRGSLPSATSHAEMVAKNTLDSIKEQVGQMRQAKMETQAANRELNKSIRDASKGITMLEELSKGLSQATFIKPQPFKKSKQSDNSKALIVCLSDIHYGSQYKLDGGKITHSTEITKALMQQYARRVVDFLVNDGNISVVHVVNLGDSVEGSQMRTQNTFEVTESIAEQQVHVTELIWNFLATIKSWCRYITYQGIAGNHDRYAGNYRNEITGENVSTAINGTIKLLMEDCEGMEYLKTRTPKFSDISVLGHNIALVHGDLNRIDKDDNALAKLSNFYGYPYDLVLGGHIHHYSMTEVGANQYQVNFGSFKGTDEFAQRNLLASGRSQGMVLIEQDRPVRVIRVPLEVN